MIVKFYILGVDILTQKYFDTRNTITKSNELIESRYKLTLQQQKIVCAVASKVRKTDTELTGCVFVIFGTTRFFMYNDTYAIVIVFALAFIIKSIFTHITKQYVRNKH